MWEAVLANPETRRRIKVGAKQKIMSDQNFYQGKAQQAWEAFQNGGNDRQSIEQNYDAFSEAVEEYKGIYGEEFAPK